MIHNKSHTLIANIIPDDHNIQNIVIDTETALAMDVLMNRVFCSVPHQFNTFDFNPLAINLSGLNIAAS